MIWFFIRLDFIVCISFWTRFEQVFLRYRDISQPLSSFIYVFRQSLDKTKIKRIRIRIFRVVSKDCITKYNFIHIDKKSSNQKNTIEMFSLYKILIFTIYFYFYQIHIAISIRTTEYKWVYSYSISSEAT